VGKYVNLPGNWLPVVSHADFYSVSDEGLMWSNRFGRLMRPGFNGGHWQVVLSDGVKRTARYVHVVMLEAFVGPLPSPEHRGLHRDDDPDHNKIDNLYWGTMQDNALDRVRNGNEWQANKVECKRGHRLEGLNLAPWMKPPRRCCLACNRASTYANFRGRKGDEAYIAELADQKFAEIMKVAAWASM